MSSPSKGDVVLAAALIAVLSLPSGVEAQQPPPLAPPSSSRTLVLEQHGVRRMERAALEVTFGGLMVGAAAPVALLVGFMTGPRTSGGVDEGVDSTVAAWCSGLALSLGGAALLTHGALQIRLLRLERRQLDLRNAHVQLAPRGASLTAEFSF